MLQHDVTAQLKGAMLGRETLRVSVIRGMIAAFTNELVAKGRRPTEALSDDEVLAVIRRLGKQRRESIEQFTKGNRSDLAEKESAELAILETYLPAAVPDEEIMRVIEEKKAALDASGAVDKGKLIGAVMQALQGRADGNKVRMLVEKSLNDG